MAKTTVNGTSEATASQAAPARATHVGTSTVLLTGVGGIVGQGILKCLSKSSYRTLGADASELAAGLYAAERGFIIPRVHDPGYIDHLVDLCVREGVRYLFPGLDMELGILSRATPRFRERGIIPIISPPEVIAVADDKLATARFLEANGLAAPRTLDLATESPRAFGFPVVLKPRRGGSRSQGVYIIRDEAELKYRLPSIDASNYVVQEYLEGDEYSAGSITFDGKCHGSMVMRRTMRDGDTHKAFVFRDPAVDAYVARVAETLKPFGPCNFQFRMRRGVPFIFEINPRVSGGACMRSYAGFNEPLMTLDFLETGEVPAYHVRPVAVLRYWAEIVVEEIRIDETRKSGGVKGIGQKL
jgi:carbamoyl-phosphate synthase large subunit